MRQNTATLNELDGTLVSRRVETSLTEKQIINLALKQYIRPLEDSIRELLINACDSHQAANNSDQAFEVEIEDDLLTGMTRITVRDYGTGVTDDFLQHGYFSLGNSTKGDQELQAGTFGLGAKAALIVSPTMEVTSYDGEQLSRVIGQLVDNSYIGVSELYREPSRELPGLSVTIWIKSGLNVEVAGTVTQWSESTGLIPLLCRLIQPIGTGAARQAKPIVRYRGGRLATYDQSWYRVVFPDWQQDKLMTLFRECFGQDLPYWVAIPAETEHKPNVIDREGRQLLILNNKQTGTSDLPIWAIVWHNARFAMPSGLFKNLQRMFETTEAAVEGFFNFNWFGKYLKISPVISERYSFQITTDRSSLVDSEENARLLHQAFTEISSAIVQHCIDGLMERDVLRYWVDRKAEPTVQDVRDRVVASRSDVPGLLGHWFHRLIAIFTPEELGIVAQDQDQDRLIKALLSESTSTFHGASRHYPDRRTPTEYDLADTYHRPFVPLVVQVNSLGRRRRTVGASATVRQLLDKLMLDRFSFPVCVTDLSISDLDLGSFTLYITLKQLRALVKAANKAPRGPRTVQKKRSCDNYFLLLKGQKSIKDLRPYDESDSADLKSSLVWAVPLHGFSITLDGSPSCEALVSLAEMFDARLVFVRGNPDPTEVESMLGARWIDQYFKDLFSRRHLDIKRRSVLSGYDSVWLQHSKNLSYLRQYVQDNYLVSFDEWFTLRTGRRYQDSLLARFEQGMQNLDPSLRKDGELENVLEILEDKPTYSSDGNVYYSSVVRWLVGNERYLYYENYLQKVNRLAHKRRKRYGLSVSGDSVKQSTAVALLSRNTYAYDLGQDTEYDPTRVKTAGNCRYRLKREISAANLLVW